jgi:hypothetical protein
MTASKLSAVFRGHSGSRLRRRERELRARRELCAGFPETPCRLQQSLQAEIGTPSPRSESRAARDSKGRGEL